MKVILLAAGRGRRFGRGTAQCPKCLVPLGTRGENLLSRYLTSFRSLGLREVAIVVGHRKEKILHECAKKGHGLSIRFIENTAYAKGSLLSLFAASHELDENCLIMDADVFFPTKALKRLVNSKHRSSFLIDPRSRSSGEEMMVMARKNHTVRIAKKIDSSLQILGEAVGFLKIGKEDGKILRAILKNFVRRGNADVEYEESYNALMKKRMIGVEKIHEFWTEMDFEEDLKKIKRHRLQKSV